VGWGGVGWAGLPPPLPRPPRPLPRPQFAQQPSRSKASPSATTWASTATGACSHPIVAAFTRTKLVQPPPGDHVFITNRVTRITMPKPPPHGDGDQGDLGLAGALELAARARSASLGRSAWPLEPARACSASLGRAKSLLRPARPRWSAQILRSSPPSLAGAPDIAAQAHSDEETCEKTIRKRCALVATRSGAQIGRSSLLGLAGAFEMAARAWSASLGREVSLLWPARPRSSAPIRRWSPLSLAGAPDIAAQAHSDEETCEKSIRKRCALVATRSEHLALFVFAPCMDMHGSALVYIYIYMYIYIYTSADPSISMLGG